MHDLRMGFKHAILQRMQCFDAVASEKSPGRPSTPRPTTKQSGSSHGMQQTRVTDFSISRILGESDAKRTKKESKSSNHKAAAATTTHASTADILDLSKRSTHRPAAALPPPTYAAFPASFLGATSATQLYAHFFPHMFPAYHPALAAPPAAYAQRYFAPYVLNNCAPAATRLPSSSHGVADATAATPANGGNGAARSKTCSRDCSECTVYHKQLAQNLTTSALPSAAASPRSAAETPADAVFKTPVVPSSSATASVPLSPSAAVISMTTVTNLNVTTKFGNLDVLRNSGTAVDFEEISYKCRICEKVFGCSQTLQAHERTHKSPRYECSDCGKGFSQLRNYKYHLSVHRGTKEFAAECPECGKTFNDKGYLSSHMKIHRNKKEYECPYCPKSFNQRVAFNMHVRIHTGVKPHKCAECGKRFSRKMLLKQHMRTHSGEKPYQCSVCGKSFADRSNMTLHHRLHSGIKPFNCPICPKAFTKKHHLKTHLNYHTGSKPYVCPHPNCNQAFSQSSNMRTHAKKCQYRPLQPASFPALTAAMPSDPKYSTASAASSEVATTNSSFSVAPQLSTSTTHNNSIRNPFPQYVGNIPLRLPPAPPLPATAFSAGIRMLSAAAFGPQLPLPPAQQQLVSTLRPF